MVAFCGDKAFSCAEEAELTASVLCRSEFHVGNSFLMMPSLKVYVYFKQS